MSLPGSHVASKTGQLETETTPLLIEVAPEPLAPCDTYSHVEGEDTSSHHVNSHNEEAEGQEEDEEANHPLPKSQVLLLCLTSVAGPLAFFSIFPYINFMIERVGHVAKTDVGFYSGLVESAFAAVQMCVFVGWGRASDCWGRKPVLVVSLLGMSATTTLFGMSTSLWQIILFRCLAGVFAGTVVTVRAMLSEISTKYTQARAFSLFSFAYNLGIFIGPLIGGALETPSEKYPSVFGKTRLFRDYPYLLPNLVISGIALLAAITTIFFVKETLHIHHSNKSIGRRTAPLSSWQLVNQPGVANVLLICNYVMLLAFTFTAVFPVFQYTPLELGGLGFSSTIIAACTGLNGAAQAIWLLLVFPKLHKRIGTGRVLWWCAMAWPVFFAGIPLCRYLRVYGFEMLFWCVGSVVLVLGSGVAMAFTGTQLALNDIAPSHDSLGTLNAIALATQSGVRAVAPAVATSVYAVGVKYNILGGQLVWLCNIVLALGLAGVLAFLPVRAQGVGEGRAAERV